MKRFHDEKPLAFALVWIGVYVVGLSLADEASRVLGMEKLVTAPVCLLMTAVLWLWLGRQGLRETYGLCGLRRPAGEYLYFLPLLLLASVNLWHGPEPQLPPVEAGLYVVSMLCVGFLEEVVFRGFLFKALCRDNLKQAIVISSLTFGIGHIVNLLSGAELVSTLLQVIYATAAGFLFTYIFLTGKSLWPCIAAHSLINSLSIFAPDNPGLSMGLASAGFLCLVSVVYAVYIVKTIRT